MDPVAWEETVTEWDLEPSEINSDPDLARHQIAGGSDGKRVPYTIRRFFTGILTEVMAVGSSLIYRTQSRQ